MRLASIIGLLVMLWATPASAGVLFSVWTEPTQNTDGTPLTNLANYRVYYGPNAANVTPCTAAATVVVVPSLNPAPPANSVVGAEITGLVTGNTYFFSVSAVNALGIESACGPIVSAAASPDGYKALVVNTVGTGQGNVSGEGAYFLNTSVTAIATPAVGSTFAGWVGAGCSGTQLSCVIPLDTNKFVTGTFNVSGGGPAPPTGLSFGPSTQKLLTVLASGPGTVTGSGIACGTDCSQHYPVSTSVPLTATPSAGQQFSGWTGACTGSGACNVVMDTDKAVTASFSNPTWTFCAQEHEICTFTGIRNVRYGENGIFTVHTTQTSPVLCDNSVFGDPIVGVFKHC